ncbi:MAG: hypothetical protein ACOYOF_19275, partial [Verrucomicrobiaceae bacterium]
MKLFASILFVVFASVSLAQQPLPAVKPATDGKVWGALIYASNGVPADLPAEVPTQLKTLPERLGKVFPFTRF